MDENAQMVEYAAELRTWLDDADPKVRVNAIRELVALGQVDWNDFAHWMMDEDKAVRDAAIDQAGYCCSPVDRMRLAELLLAVIERYADFYAGNELEMLLHTDDTLLDAVWVKLERLLGKNDPEINSLLLCCLFEHIIPRKGWGPDDPHIKSWITGTSHTRQAMLLAIANREGLQTKRFREIVQALAHSTIPAVANEAGAMLREKR